MRGVQEEGMRESIEAARVNGLDEQHAAGAQLLGAEAQELNQVCWLEVLRHLGAEDPSQPGVGQAGEIPEGVGPALSGPGGGGAGAGRGGSVRVVAEVFNVRGQRIRLVMDEELIAGQHSIEWDGRSDRGAAVGAGLYVLRLRAGSFTATRKLIVVSR